MWLLRRMRGRSSSEMRVFLAVLLLVALTVFSVHRAFFRERVLHLNPELLRQLEERDRAELDEKEEEEEEYYDYPEVVVFDKLDPNEIMLNSDMFFFVTSGANDLREREACPVEAAARLHRGRKIFVVFMTANITDVLQSPTLLNLLSFENVHLRYISPVEYIQQSKAATSWLLESNFHKLPNGNVFLAQALTYLFLHRFGGTVLGFDTILLEPVTSLGQFVARCDEEERVVTHPATVDAGNPLLAEVLSSAAGAFDPTRPEETGGRLVASKLREACGVRYLKELRFRDCPIGVKATSPSTFCPVEEEKHWMLLDPSRERLVSSRMRGGGEGDVRGLRLWSEHNAAFSDWGSRARPTAVFQAAEKACPLVVQVMGEQGVL